MGVVENAEGNAWEVRGDEGGPYAIAAYSNGKGSIASEGPSPQHLGIRVDRASRTGGIPRGGIAGGILEQLVIQAEEQLREAAECIEWYQRSFEKAQRQLENLRQLQALAEEENQGD